MDNSTAPPAPHQRDAIIVGAGFAGIYMLYRLRSAGFSASIIEGAPRVGGVWYWNRYPGAKCDVESADYSYSFSPELDQEWTWSERFAGQAEIQAYLEYVVDRFELRDHIRFNTRVVGARFDEDHQHWVVETDTGEQVEAQFCIMATGCLSVPAYPSIPGMDTFAGAIHHTAEWPEEGVDLEGRRVGIIGVGSSGTQMVPIVSQVASSLHVFQRTPNFTVPSVSGAVDDEFIADLKRTYPERRQRIRSSPTGLSWAMNRKSAAATDPDERRRTFEKHWEEAGFGFLMAFYDLLLSEDSNATAVEFVAEKIREIVKDPDVAERLIPRTYPFGAKRPCVEREYYPSFNLPNVTLVDLCEDPIERIAPDGVVLASGTVELDLIALATGFDAITGALDRIAIRGRGGRALRDAWSAGPVTYLGLGTAGFPNLFFLAGAGSPSVLTNVVVSIEQHVEWVGDLIEHMRAVGTRTVEACEGAQEEWVEHVNEVANATLYPAAGSWYLGANVPGKPRVFMPYAGGLRAYRKKCDEVAARGYEGFVLK